MPHVLVIDDDRTVSYLVREAFQGTDIRISTASSAKDGMALLASEPADTVLLDVVLPETSGMEMFEQIHKRDPKLPVVFITAHGDSDTAIQAMKTGAYDYILKPLDMGQLRVLVGQALETRRLMYDPVGLPDCQEASASNDQLLGRSPSMLEVYKAIGRVASQDVTVLVRGESGTGKELIARAIYHHSRRAGGPFLAVNCAAIPDTLLESDLFGHEKGAFTGADRMRVGKFEQCSGGTLFLDEIGDMSPLVQSKVLRILQEQRFERVGGNQTIKTDVRIIAATNRDLEAMVADGTYRPDLYYRLNGYSIDLPPLRERGDDIVLLTEQFIARYARELEKEVHGVSPQALEALIAYPWPGNIRELQGVIKKALIQATGPVVVPEFLPNEVLAAQKNSAARDERLPPSDLAAFLDEKLHSDADNVYGQSLEMMERYLLARVLRLTGGNQSKAARILGITRGNLRNKLHTLGMSIGQVLQFEQEAAEEAVSAAT
jgi:two-component system nitrogen regulation response regulator GlnG